MPVDAERTRLDFARRLILAKGGAAELVSLIYFQSLDDAIYHGWTDRQSWMLDEAVCAQRSKGEERVVATQCRRRCSAGARGGRQPQARGIAENANGDAAYSGSADVGPPADVMAAFGNDFSISGDMARAEPNEEVPPPSENPIPVRRF